MCQGRDSAMGQCDEPPKCGLLQQTQSTSQPAPSFCPPWSVLGASQSFAEDLDLQRYRCHLNRTRCLGAKFLSAAEFVLCLPQLELAGVVGVRREAADEPLPGALWASRVVGSPH